MEGGGIAAISSAELAEIEAQAPRIENVKKVARLRAVKVPVQF